MIENTSFTHFKYYYMGSEYPEMYNYACFVMSTDKPIRIVVGSDAKKEFRDWLTKKCEEAETHRGVVKMQAKMFKERIDRLDLDDEVYKLYTTDGKIIANLYGKIHEDLEPETFFDVRKR